MSLGPCDPSAACASIAQVWPTRIEHPSASNALLPLQAHTCVRGPCVWQGLRAYVHLPRTPASSLNSDSCCSPVTAFVEWSSGAANSRAIVSFPVVHATTGGHWRRHRLGCGLQSALRCVYVSSAAGRCIPIVPTRAVTPLLRITAGGALRVGVL